ncbi:hypothetical protein BpHYR1_016956 [Brachionus plicatilis]|uniref:Uncharacterized protein n=1 Tax=Brachionus plicatilis TaxID=10195 RepID=A0A3M7SSK6_BRAPC|nr:hypothetical protein BpHYR1_016956 [Brachionus plicatilis]
MNKFIQPKINLLNQTKYIFSEKNDKPNFFLLPFGQSFFFFIKTLHFTQNLLAVLQVHVLSFQFSLFISIIRTELTEEIISSKLFYGSISRIFNVKPI